MPDVVPDDTNDPQNVDPAAVSSIASSPQDVGSDDGLGLDYQPQTPSSGEKAPGVAKGSVEAGADFEKKVEVQKSPEVLASKPGDTTPQDSPQEKVATIAPQTDDDLEEHVVDLRTGHEPLDDVKSAHPLTKYADDEEGEFIEGVEHCHDTQQSE